MEKEKVELIKFDEGVYLEEGKKVYEQRESVEAVADKLTQDGYSNIFLLGIGGTEFELYQFEYLVKRMSNIDITLINAAEANVVRPSGLTKDSIVITASDSGNTPEIIESAKWMVDEGIRVVAFTKKDGVLGQIAQTVIEVSVATGMLEYSYLVEAFLIYKLVNNNGDFEEYPTFANQLKGIFKDLLSIRKMFEPKADKIARNCYKAPYTVFTGSGALWGETELFAECLLEEMQWIRTRPITSAKFFHGTLELIEPGVPVFVIKGEDEFRKLDNRVENFCKKINAESYVIDTAEYSLSVDEKYRHLCSPWIITALLTERLTQHYENYTMHNQNYRRYYRQFDY